MAREAKVGNAIHQVHGTTHVHPGAVQAERPARVLFSHGGSLRNCLLVEGSTGLIFDDGHSFSHEENIGIGPGFHCVNVQLSGWDLDFEKKDHHLDHIAVQIKDVVYDEESGNVKFDVEGFFRDKNGDDLFEWEVKYTILALG
jgi:hypothetical protein